MSATIEQRSVRQLRIVGAPKLDPIVAYLDELSPNAGHLTLTCYGKAWTAYWGNVGGCGLAHFIADANIDYLVNCLDRGLDVEVYDPDAVRSQKLAEVLRLRRARQLSKEQAYQQYWELEDLYLEDDPWRQPKVMNELLGDEWPSLLPMQPNPDYAYLTRIVEAVRVALAATATTQPSQEEAHV